jgi:zinc protease
MNLKATNSSKQSTRSNPATDQLVQRKKYPKIDHSVNRPVAAVLKPIDWTHECQRCIASIAAAMAITLTTPLQSQANTTPLYDYTSLPPLPSKFAPLPELKLPSYKQITLSNGLRVIMLEDHEAPFLRGSLLVKGGQRASPDDKVGLATLSAQLQRSGGSINHPGQSFDDTLEDVAAGIEGGASPDTLSLGFQCLVEDADSVVGLLSELITSPALPPSRLELLKKQALNYLEHKNDNPSAIPTRELSKIIYGRNSPYAREASPQSVESITVADVERYLTTWLRPDAAVIGIVGDMPTSQMKQLVEQKLGGKVWKRPDTMKPPDLPTPPLPDQSGVAGKAFILDIALKSNNSNSNNQIRQTAIAMGELGVEFLDPDLCALDTLSGIFNSFGGRIFNEIRTREGLAYSVGAGWASAPLDHPGLFIATAETGQPGQLYKALQSELALATNEAPTEEELERAKQENINSFVFNFSSPVAQVRRIVGYELFGIPQDYVFRTQKCSNDVRGEDVLGAAQKHLHPRMQTVVAVGDGALLKKEFKQLGLEVEDLILD